MKKFFLILFSILRLFSCATGKELERVETIVEKVEEKDVIEEVETESVPFTSIEEEEEEELDLSSLPVLFDDGEFIDIKDESAAIQKEEKASETPIVVEKETVEIEHKEVDEKDKNPAVYILLASFVILASIILLVFFSGRKKREGEKEEAPIWEEKEEYSSILEILAEEKSEENM